MKKKTATIEMVAEDYEDLVELDQWMADVARITAVKVAGHEAWTEARKVWKYSTESEEDRVDKLYQIVCTLNSIIQGENE